MTGEPNARPNRQDVGIVILLIVGFAVVMFPYHVLPRWMRPVKVEASSAKRSPQELRKEAAQLSLIIEQARKAEAIEAAKKDPDLTYLTALMAHTAKVQENAQLVGYTTEMLSKGKDTEKASTAFVYALMQQRDLANEGKDLTATARFSKSKAEYNNAMDDLIYVSEHLLPAIQYSDQARIGECTTRTRHAKRAMDKTWRIAEKEVKRIRRSTAQHR